MLMAGGEGGGKLLSTSLALARARLPVHLVVVCGRNEHSQQKLAEMSRDAADADAGARLHRQDSGVFPRRRSAGHQSRAGTLAEANAAQLPVIVYDYVPGQERGNLDFVRHNGLGEVAIGGASRVVEAVRSMIRTPETPRCDPSQSRDRRAAPQFAPDRRAHRANYQYGRDSAAEYLPLAPLRQAAGV